MASFGSAFISLSREQVWRSRRSLRRHSRRGRAGRGALLRQYRLVGAAGDAVDILNLDAYEYLDIWRCILTKCAPFWIAAEHGVGYRAE